MIPMSEEMIRIRNLSERFDKLEKLVLDSLRKIVDAGNALESRIKALEEQDNG